MPSGYTAAVVDGTSTSLKDFALHCATAFYGGREGTGAILVDPDNGYHAEQLKEAHAWLKQLVNMTPEERADAAQAEYDNALAYCQTTNRKTAEVRRRYQDMRAKVVAWEGGPAELKKFMLEQLDTGATYDNLEAPLPTFQPAEEWYAEHLESAMSDIKYRQRELVGERERAIVRNAWIKQLHDSLPSEA